MDTEELKRYLKKKGKLSNSIERCIGFTEQFESFLSEHRKGKSIDRATKEDLEEFVCWLEEIGMAPNAALWGLSLYFEYTSNDELSQLASKLRAARKKKTPFKIKEFKGLDNDDVRNLEKIGLSTVVDVLEACKTPEKRKEVSERTGISEDTILEITKLSDLARIQGLKGIRARLYFDAGITTLDDIASYDPENLRITLTKFIEESGFDGIPPWPKEASFSVRTAKKLPRIIEYE